MSVLLLRVLERVHGHLAWLAVLAVLHPAILLRNPRRRARLAVSLSAGTVVAAGVLGALIYPSYRDHVKQRLFIEHPRVGWLFERKEHLAVGVIAMALAGCIAHLCLPMFEDEPTRRTAATLAHRAFVASFLLALVTACLGVAIASVRSF